MVKKIPNTLQQRLGFMDPELARPDHDQIILWLNKNVGEILSQHLEPQEPWPQHTIDVLTAKTQAAHAKYLAALQQRLDQCINEPPYSGEHPRLGIAREKAQAERVGALRARIAEVSQIGITPPQGRPPIKVDTPVLEYPVKDTQYKGKAYVVGFVDMAVTYHVPTLELRLNDLNDSQNLESMNEFYGPQFMTWREHNAYFEVKTEIPSLGELMRQINLYRAYLRGSWFVVSPDIRFRDVLVEQGVRFVEYKPDIG